MFLVTLKDFSYILENLEMSPLKLSGKVTIKGTRITLNIILNHIEAGSSIQELIELYPTLSDKLEVLGIIETNIQKAKCIHNLLKKLWNHVKYLQGIPHIKHNRRYIPIHNVDRNILKSVLKEEVSCLSEEEIDEFVKRLPKIIKTLTSPELEKYSFLRSLRRKSAMIIKEKHKKAPLIL